MASLAQLPNSVLGIMVGWLLVSCQPITSRQPDTVLGQFVRVDQPGWQRRDGKLWLNDSLFTGYQYETTSTSDTLFVGGYQQGNAEGQHRYRYENHQLREQRQYHNNWQEGEQRGWYESGQQAFVYQFQKDVYEGWVQEWYPNGQLAHDGHYHDGQEFGAQRFWLANGTVKANYVARNGRQYGIIMGKGCVSDEKQVNRSDK